MPAPARAQMVDDHVRLLVAQESLEQEAPGKAFVGLSVNETLRQCLLAGMDKRADKLRSEFKVPDKRCASPALAPAPRASLAPHDLGGWWTAGRLLTGATSPAQVLVPQAAGPHLAARLGRARRVCAREKLADRVRAVRARAHPRGRAPPGDAVRREVRREGEGRAVCPRGRVGERGEGVRQEE